MKRERIDLHNAVISSMSEEVRNPEVKMPRAISLCIPVGGIAGLFFVIPVCVTM